MKCPACDGSGEIDFPFSEEPEQCFKCEGSGYISLKEWAGWKWSKYRRYFLVECPACDGEGGEQHHVVGCYGGPFYECGYCDGACLISPWKWVKWHWWIAQPPKPIQKVKQIVIYAKHGEWINL